MSKIGWIHPTDNSDQWDGFNESGIEHFSGSPIRHLAREVVQNSLDSHASSSSPPVKVVIKEVSIKTSQIPNVDELKETFRLCLLAAENESQKAKSFFEAALKELDRPNTRVLEIADFNTKGIKGPAKNGSPYYAFMKAKGQSKKSSETAAGSFGIGKFAPYAVSKLRTVFVSTVFKDDQELLTQLSQGKSILMSHDDDSEVRHQGVGFWGIKEKCQPVDGMPSTLPKWLLRANGSQITDAEVGTKLLILGFESHAGWQQSLAASIVENFFGAIQTGKLEVLIDGKYAINASTISDVFGNKDIAQSIANEKNEPEQFENSKAYYDCLFEHEDTFIEQTQNLHLGLCELKILIREGLPKKVSFLRNGMFISDSLSLHGLKNFSEFKDFAAVFQCRDDKGIELLRAMEPPRHDDFEPDRLSSKDDQAKAKKALKDMATWIRDMLRRRAKDPISEITKLDELKEFFADDSEDGQGNGLEEVNPFGRIVIKAKPVSYKKPVAIGNEMGDSSSGGTEESGGGGGGADGDGGGDSSGGEGGASGNASGGGSAKPMAPMTNLRAVITSDNARRLAFTPLASGRYSISLFESGADSEYLISATKSSIGVVQNGRIEVDALKGVRQVLDVELSENFVGALKVVAYEV
jgi:uncharacterized membrane protein YgcG